MTLRLGTLAYPVTRVGSLDAWATKLDVLVAEGARNADLLLMPEYACMETAAALGADGDPADELSAVANAAATILRIMRDAARRRRVWLQPGTLPWRSGDAVVNRAPFINPDGAVAFQDKSAMTRFEAESWCVTSGAPPVVFETTWGRIGLAICYDAEFPTLVRPQVEAGAWLILVPTCTDTPHGFNRVEIAARARAMENQCHVAVAPTVGDAPWLAALDVNRGRAVISGPVDRGFPEDGIIAAGAMDTPGWTFATLDPHAIARVREDGAVRNHRDWPAQIPPPRIITPEQHP
ncbi:carbon-nitrogen hydrolase family protein [Roseomonas sp. CCTCC AB2023176]|uniref:carbon-nitrogen hydrolase family protein n=1 Tax=Roseomonas sp. CCTCC AB2023176 TaxID=3342640 RepID=UPI0035DC1714